MTENLLLAFALMLVLEGLVPFIAPSAWRETFRRLIEFSENGKLCMISIIDMLVDGLSSVYTFYDADISAASYGTYAVLWQITQCQRLELPYLYIGYWIRDSRKMAYKSNFRPLEAYVAGKWGRV